MHKQQQGVTRQVDKNAESSLAVGDQPRSTRRKTSCFALTGQDLVHRAAYEPNCAIFLVCFFFLSSLSLSLSRDLFCCQLPAGFFLLSGFSGWERLERAVLIEG